MFPKILLITLERNALRNSSFKERVDFLVESWNDALSKIFVEKTICVTKGEHCFSSRPLSFLLHQ